MRHRNCVSVRVRQGVGGLALGIVAAALAGCTAEPAPAPAPACEAPLLELLERQGVLPAAPLGPRPGPMLYPDTTLPAFEGLVVDPSPLGRGEHPVARWWLDPTSCQPVGGLYAFGPPPPGALPPAEANVGETGQPTWRVRALLVTGDDPGATTDALAWDRALDALGAVARHLHRPTREALEAAVRDDLCGSPVRDVTALLIVAGRASPAEGGALLLEGEAISWRRLGELVATRCEGVGLVVAVLDAGHADGFGDALSEGPPAVLWRAADAAHPDAPRLAPDDGGLLSAALSEEVFQRARAQCLGVYPSPGEPGPKTVHPTPDEVVRAFAPDGVRERMVSLRWRLFGEPWLASDDPAAALPSAVTRGVELLSEDLPLAPHAALGDLPGGSRCTLDEHCVGAFAGCVVQPCHAWRCEGGRCRVVEDVGGRCDDRNDCTLDDRCQPGGTCVGELDRCDDANACTADVCVFGDGCLHVPIEDAGACDDGSACTEDDACDDDGACTGTPLDCDDGNPCTVDTCDPDDGCDHDEVAEPCDDGDACTHSDFCKDGDCLGVAKPCHDGEDCTFDGCDPSTGACLFPPRPDGVACDDGTPCTLGDGCLDGTCEGAPKDCDDGLACTFDACDAGQCVHLPGPGSCATADGCVVVGESPPDQPCLTCVATDVLAPSDGAPCPDDGVACTADYCEAGVCVHPNAPGTCHGPDGTCVQVGEMILPCLLCADTGVGSPGAVGEPCDDGDACTVDDACDALGACRGDALGCCPPGPGVVCGGTIEGDTSAPGTPRALQSWSCLPGAVFDAPERAHSLIAPCTGPYQFQLSAPFGMDLLVVRGALDTCGDGTCATYAPTVVAQTLQAGEEVTLVVDGLNDTKGAYAITVTCPCVEDL